MHPTAMHPTAGVGGLTSETVSTNPVDPCLGWGFAGGVNDFLAIGWCRWCGDRCRSPACLGAHVRASYCVLPVFEWPLSRRAARGEG